MELSTVIDHHQPFSALYEGVINFILGVKSPDLRHM